MRRAAAAAQVRRIENLRDVTANEAEQRMLDIYEDACATVVSLREQLAEAEARRDRVKSGAVAILTNFNKQRAHEINNSGEAAERIVYDANEYYLTANGYARRVMSEKIYGRSKGKPLTQTESNEAWANGVRAGIRADGYVLIPLTADEGAK